MLTYTEYPDDDVRRYLEVMPVSIIRYLEQNEFACAERVH